MKSYYEKDGIVVYHGDCCEVLTTLGSVDLVLTDPPYGVSYQSNARNQKMPAIVGDDSADIALAGIKSSLSCLRNNRHLYIFGRYDLTGLPLTECAELIWDKGSPSKGNLASTYGVSHEYIQFTTFVPSKANRSRGDGRLAARLRRGSILYHPRLNSRRVHNHPTEKPVGLLRELIEASSLLGETVLDPFMGVGSTLIAAQLEGRKAIGIEIEERYCEIAANRLSQDILL